MAKIREFHTTWPILDTTESQQKNFATGQLLTTHLYLQLMAKFKYKNHWPHLELEIIHINHPYLPDLWPKNITKKTQKVLRIPKTAAPISKLLQFVQQGPAGLGIHDSPHRSCWPILGRPDKKIVASNHSKVVPNESWTLTFSLIHISHWVKQCGLRGFTVKPSPCPKAPVSALSTAAWVKAL